MARSAANPETLLTLAQVMDDWCDVAHQVTLDPPAAPSSGGSSVGSSVGLVAPLLHAAKGVVERQRAAAAALRTTRRSFLAADRRRSTALLRGRAWGVDVAVATMHLLAPRGSAPGRHLAVADAAKGHLLRFDPRGDGRVVEVLGDLATADHVAVLIPGMTNDIGNYRANHRAKAAHLLAEMRRQARPGERVAVVSWLGYDTPDGLLTARASKLAKAGATELRRDLEVLATINRHAHVTVIGHSYGSVVLGQAMKRGLAPALHVTDAIAVGSPGMDATDRSQLGSKNVTLHATRNRARTVSVLGLHLPAPADLVPIAPAHGEDPAVPGFHAEPFSSDDVASHGAYFDPGTVALLGMARIATGRPPTQPPTVPPTSQPAVPEAFTPTRRGKNRRGRFARSEETR